MSERDPSTLPKWAQEKIRKLERERSVAVRVLADYVEQQKESPVYIDDLVCDGRERGPSCIRRYIQDARCVTFNHAGLELHVTISDPEHIDIKWNANYRLHGETTMVPHSYQNVKLYAVKGGGA